jgi:hypothetical protein
MKGNKKDNGYEKNMCEISFKLSSPRGNDWERNRESLHIFIGKLSLLLLTFSLLVISISYTAKIYLLLDITLLYQPLSIHYHQVRSCWLTVKWTLLGWINYEWALILKGLTKTMSMQYHEKLTQLYQPLQCLKAIAPMKRRHIILVNGSLSTRGTE